MIPKIIHQIWLGDKKKRPVVYMRKWKKMNPTWKYCLWTEENLFPLINQRHFDNINTYNGKSDILRYEIVCKYGGFYIDADTNPLVPLEDELINCDLFSCYDNDRSKSEFGKSATGVVWKKRELIATGFLASTPNHPFIGLVIHELSKMKLKIPKYNDYWITIGPLFFTKMVQKHKPDIKIYPSHYFLPRHIVDYNYTEGDKVYCDHFWGTSVDNLNFQGKKYAEWCHSYEKQILYL